MRPDGRRLAVLIAQANALHVAQTDDAELQRILTTYPDDPIVELVRAEIERRRQARAPSSTP